MRTKSATLITAEKSVTSTPYISVVLSNGTTTYTYSTTDSPSRVKSVRHSEQPYSDFATIILRNNDKTLPASLIGYKCDISYGYRVAGVTYLTTPAFCAPLWVKSQYQLSKGGNTDIVLYLEGCWSVLGETEYIASLLAAAAAPYYDIDYSSAAYTVYDIIEAVLAGMNFDLSALGIHDDSIIDTLLPKFMVNYQGSIEDARSVIYRLLSMTKCFMRVESAVTEVGSWDTVASGVVVGGSDSYNTRSTFDTATRHWVTYMIRTDPAYGTLHIKSRLKSGGAWSSVVDLGTLFNPTVQPHCLWYDGTNVHYVRVDSSGEDWSTVYRVFTPNDGDGTITFLAADQTIVSSVSVIWIPLSITIDSAGRIYCNVQNSSWPEHHLYRNANTDGTWATDIGFPITTAVRADRANMIPLGSGSIYIVYLRYDDAAIAEGRTFDGTNLGDVESISSTVCDVRCPSIVSLSDGSIAGAYNKNTGTAYKLYGLNRTSGGVWSEVEIATTGIYTDTPVTKLSDDLIVCYCIYGGYLNYTTRESGVWKTPISWVVSSDLQYPPLHLHVSAPYESAVPSASILVYTVSKLFTNITFNSDALFRIIYPTAWTSYHSTFTSDRPDATYHQFKEFEWQDHLLIPTNVIVVANRVDKEDGTWDEDQMVVGGWSITPENGYPEIIQYHIAETLTTEVEADMRSLVVEIRQWMEAALGRVLVQHDCGLELYDYIQIRDKRGVADYVDYPTAKWISTYTYKMCVVGSLLHIFQADKGVYDLEITLNGISSTRSMFETVKAASIETGIERVGGTPYPTPVYNPSPYITPFVISGNTESAARVHTTIQNTPTEPMPKFGLLTKDSFLRKPGESLVAWQKRIGMVRWLMMSGGL